jgi:hypothetical protein
MLQAGNATTHLCGQNGLHAKLLEPEDPFGNVLDLRPSQPLGRRCSHEVVIEISQYECWRIRRVPYLINERAERGGPGLKAFENYTLVFETEMSNAFDDNTLFTVAPVK